MALDADLEALGIEMIAPHRLLLSLLYHNARRRLKVKLALGDDDVLAQVR
jgi:hypothetical protein